MLKKDGQESSLSHFFFLQNHLSISNDSFWIFVIREQLFFKKKNKVFEKKM
jgi:hypothetical protein